jgi:hypothetical protein
MTPTERQQRLTLIIARHAVYVARRRKDDRSIEYVLRQAGECGAEAAEAIHELPDFEEAVA